MFRYVDGKGNEFVLQPEGERRLRYRPCADTVRGAEAAAVLDLPLSGPEYMRLVSAFAMAIDNKLGHCELCNTQTSTILTMEDGRQRRYFLSPSSTERAALEGLLSQCLTAA